MDIIQRNKVRVLGSAGPVLLFAHGFGCNQHMWDAVAPLFSARYRVVLFDYTGSGPATGLDHEPERYATLDGYARDLMEVCDALGLDSEVTLVAHSVSCSIGGLVAIARPSLFASMVWLGPSPCFVNHPPEYRGGFEQADLAGLLSLMDQNYIGWASMVSPMVAGKSGEGAVSETLTTSFCSTDPHSARMFARATFYADNRRDLALIKCPCLILQHRYDALAPLEVGEYLRDHLACGRLEVLEVSGHCAHMSNPDQVIDALQRHLATPAG